MNLNSIKSGLTAGFVATVVLSILMTVKAMMGVMPSLNPIADIATVADNFTGLQLPPPVGWVGHFFIGTIVWGILYALIEPYLPGAPIVKGLIFAVIAWLAMMILFMPLAGQGFFVMHIGPAAAVATLVLHLIYGGVLGAVYANSLVTDPSEVLPA